MRIRRYLLAIVMVTTGAVIARPDDVMPLASRIAAAWRANIAPDKGVAAQPVPETTAAAPKRDLPAFVPSSHDLRFPEQAAAPAPQQIKPIITDAAATGASDGDAKGSGNSQPGDAQTAALSDAPGALTSLDADGTPQRPSAEDARLAAAPGAPRVIAAKTLFGAAKAPSLLQARSIGTYSRGCLAGAVALPVDGPAWQAMRLSRNRNWGHPKLVEVVEKLANTAQKQDGWPGLLVGDISQPRGGPMLTGHASHQLGLDADIWLTPMPDHKLTRAERENIAATSMLDKTDLAVDPKVFTDKHVALIKRAASLPEVERVLVHPAIKKALCQAAGTDRGWLGKVRPIQGHYYHFHIRIGCPPGSTGCVAQKPVTGDDGCTKEVDDWLARMARAKLPAPPAPPRPPGWTPPPPPQPITMPQLPADCRMVLESGADGVTVPPEAMVVPPPAKPQGKAQSTKKHEPLLKATITLRPAKDRRAAEKN